MPLGALRGIRDPRGLAERRLPGQADCEATSNIQSYVIFIVRDDRPCDLLFQCSDLTWSAYNRWPADYSIYTHASEVSSNTGVPSGTVSFDRPYGLFTHPVNRMKKSGGSGEYLPWEFPLSFWMEQHGYDVSYISNIDTHADPKGLLRAKGFISVGHDEYWTKDMYQNVLTAREQGVNLAFFGGNSVLCVVPLLPSGKGHPKPGRAARRLVPALPGRNSGSRQAKDAQPEGLRAEHGTGWRSTDGGATRPQRPIRQGHGSG